MLKMSKLAERNLRKRITALAGPLYKPGLSPLHMYLDEAIHRDHEGLLDWIKAMTARTERWKRAVENDDFATVDAILETPELPMPIRINIVCEPLIEVNGHMVSAAVAVVN